MNGQPEDLDLRLARMHPLLVLGVKFLHCLLLPIFQADRCCNEAVLQVVQDFCSSRNDCRTWREKRFVLDQLLQSGLKAIEACVQTVGGVSCEPGMEASAFFGIHSDSLHEMAAPHFGATPTSGTRQKLLAATKQGTSVCVRRQWFQPG